MVPPAAAAPADDAETEVPMVLPSVTSPNAAVPFRLAGLGETRVRDPHFWGKMSLLAMAVRVWKDGGGASGVVGSRGAGPGSGPRQPVPQNVQRPPNLLSHSLHQAILASERITGQGAIQALDLAVGVPLWEVEAPIAVLVGVLLLGGLSPSPITDRTPGGLIKSALYRASFLGLAAVLVCEAATGRGALATLELETGVGALTEVEAVAVFVALVLLTSPTRKE